MLVLRPKGKFRIADKHTIQSKLGTARLQVDWKPIELWMLSAEEFLSEGDVGILPWVPLMQMDGPPESVLEALRGQDRTRGDAQTADGYDGGIGGHDATPVPRVPT